MNISKLNILVTAFCVLMYLGCKKEAATNTNKNTVEASKEGVFKGSFAFVNDETDTLIEGYEITVKKIATNTYNILSADGELDLDIIDNNGSIAITDELKDLFTNFTGKLTSSVLTIQANGDDDGNLFQMGFNGIKNNPNVTPGEEYFIFDNSTINCNPERTSCEITQSSYSYFYFGIYDNENTGGSLLIRTKNVPTPGTYSVASYQKFEDENLGTNECIVIASKTHTAPNYYSTGTKGTLVVTQQNGKLVYQLSNVSVALGKDYPELTVSAAKGYCK